MRAVIHSLSLVCRFICSHDVLPLSPSCPCQTATLCAIRTKAAQRTMRMMTTPSCLTHRWRSTLTPTPTGRTPPLPCCFSCHLIWDVCVRKSTLCMPFCVVRSWALIRLVMVKLAHHNVKNFLPLTGLDFTGTDSPSVMLNSSWKYYLRNNHFLTALASSRVQ